MCLNFELQLPWNETLKLERKSLYSYQDLTKLLSRKNEQKDVLKISRIQRTGISPCWFLDTFNFMWKSTEGFAQFKFEK